MNNEDFKYIASRVGFVLGGTTIVLLVMPWICKAFFLYFAWVHAL